MTPVQRLRAQLRARVGRLLLQLELDTAEGTLVIVGPNGAGKSSLLGLLLGVLPVEQGRVEIGETLLLDTEQQIDVPLEQRRLGYVPQDYALFPHLNVRENIAFALASAPAALDAAAAPSTAGPSTAGPNREGLARRVDAMLNDLGLTALSERHVQTLSGGEKQRVALARALSIRPQALLLDEPLAALDVHARREVRAFLAAYLTQLGLPTIVVTHDASDARQLGQRIAVMEAGKITQVGRWDELVAQPASHFVAEFVASATARVEP